MNSSRHFTVVAMLAVVATIAAVPVSAQTDASAPIVVRKMTTSAKGTWLKAEIIHADSNSMVVREQANGMMIHTFTYSADLQDKIQKLMDQGGYQYGDRVMIFYQPGQTVALRIFGKPSKAL
jgi:hypothetical protein